jgi:zona occludens toxin
MRYEWEGIADPSSTKSLAIAQNSRWVFPTSAYGTYKSAVEHTHKVKLPWKRMLTLGAGLVVVIAGVWFAFSVLRPKPKPVVVDSSGRSVKGEVVNKSVSGSDYWVKDRQVRITGVPASAALYDPLQKVRTQPRPEGCMRLDVGQAVRCTCTGPNSSELAIPVPQCLDLVKRGWFDETTRYEDAKVANIAQLNAGARGVVTNAKDGEPKAQEAE